MRNRLAVAAATAGLLLFAAATQSVRGADAASRPVASATPPAVSATQPAVSTSPAALMHRYLRAIDARDREAALKCWSTAGRDESLVAAGQVDMALAVARLKAAVRKRIGADAPFELNMAVVSEDECGPIKETIEGDTAQIEVASVDEKQVPRDYSLVRAPTAGWELSAAAVVRDAGGITSASVAAARQLIAIVNKTADAVSTGAIRDVETVKQRISGSMPAP